MWIKTGIISLSISILILTGFGCSLNREDDKNLDKVKREFENSLQEKYHEKFTVIKIKTYYQGLGDPKQFVAEAYPENNKDLIFGIRRYEDYEKMGDPSFIENYLNILWTKQAEESIEKDFKEIFHNQEKFQFTILAYSELIENWRYDSMSYIEANKKFSNEMDSFLQILIFNSYDNTAEKKKVAEDVYTLLKKIHDKGISNIEIGLAIYNPSYSKNIRKNSDYYFSIFNQPRLDPIERKKLVHECAIPKEKTGEIQKAEDVLLFCEQ